MFYLFLFGCTGSLLLHGLSLVAVSRGYSFIAVPRASRCSGFSCCGTQAPESTGFSSCGSWALEYRLSSCGVWPYLLWGMWDLPRPGIEPVSIALQGGFFTTEPSGKPLREANGAGSGPIIPDDRGVCPNLPPDLPRHAHLGAQTALTRSPAATGL